MPLPPMITPPFPITEDNCCVGIYEYIKALEEERTLVRRMCDCHEACSKSGQMLIETLLDPSTSAGNPSTPLEGLVDALDDDWERDMFKIFATGFCYEHPITRQKRIYTYDMVKMLMGEIHILDKHKSELLRDFEKEGKASSKVIHQQLDDNRELRRQLEEAQVEKCKYQMMHAQEKDTNNMFSDEIVQLRETNRDLTGKTFPPLPKRVRRSARLAAAEEPLLIIDDALMAYPESE